MTTTSTKTDLILEGLQMGMEANAASAVMIHARIRMIAEHIGLDVSTPTLTKDEESNKDRMLELVDQRVIRMLQMGAEIEGHPAPSHEDTEQFREKMKNEIWPENGDTVTPDPFEGTIFGGAEPVYPTKNTMPLDNSHAPSANSPLEFQTTRRAVRPYPKDVFIVYVWEQDEYTVVALNDPKSRKAAWDTIVQFYCDLTEAAVKDNWLSQPWADRLCQEYMLSLEDTELTSPMVIPDPSDVSTSVAKYAANGDTEITIKGITDESQVVEALMTAFMVSAARFNINIGEALVEARMEQLGFKL